MKSFEEANIDKEKALREHLVNEVVPTARIAAACGGDDLVMALEMHGCGGTFAIESESEREAKAARLARLREKSIKEGKFQR